MVFCLEYNIENVIGQVECRSANIIQILARSSKQELQLPQAFGHHIVMNLQFDLQNGMSLQFVLQNEMNPQYDLQNEKSLQFGLQNEMNHQYDLHFEMSRQCDLHFERNLLFISKTKALDNK